MSSYSQYILFNKDIFFIIWSYYRAKHYKLDCYIQDYKYIRQFDRIVKEQVTFKKELFDISEDILIRDFLELIKSFQNEKNYNYGDESNRSKKLNDKIVIYLYKAPWGRFGNMKRIKHFNLLDTKLFSIKYRRSGSEILNDDFNDEYRIVICRYDWNGIVESDKRLRGQMKSPGDNIDRYSSKYFIVEIAGVTEITMMENTKIKTENYNKFIDSLIH